MNKLSKKEIIKKVSDKNVNGLSNKVIESVVNDLLDVVAESLTDGDSVDLFGFGKFEIKKISARTGINPATKEKIDIPASKSVKFKVAKALKEKVNK